MIRKRIIKINTVILLVLACLFTGCRKNADSVPMDEGVFIYRVNADGTGLYVEPYDYPLESEDFIEHTISLLSEPASKNEYTAPVGSAFSLLKSELSDGVLHLDFSEEYKAQESTDEILKRAAIVRTLTQSDKISGLSFTVEGEPLSDKNGVPLGVMSGDQFILNAGREINAYERSTVTLYFADEDGTGLKEVKRTVVYSGNISLDRVVMDELIKGVSEGEDVYPCINPATKVLSTTVNDLVCYVNLDSSFLTQYYTVRPEVTIYSIVDSLVQLPNINKVMISVDGDSSVTFLENISLSAPFERNLDIID